MITFFYFNKIISCGGDMLKKEIICFVIIGMLLTVFSSVLATGFEADAGETTEIKLTEKELAEINNWCESIDDENLRIQVRNALDETINSDGVLCMQELEQKLQSIDHDSSATDPASPAGILPAVAIVRCKWERTSNDDAGRTIKFWLLGWGGHILNFHTYDDHDSDGEYETHQSRHYEWFSLMIPLKSYDNYHSWGGYPGTAKVKVTYTLDGKSATKTFQEGSSDDVSKTLNKKSFLLNIFERLIQRFPMLEQFLNNVSNLG